MKLTNKELIEYHAAVRESRLRASKEASEAFSFFFNLLLEKMGHDEFGKFDENGEDWCDKLEHYVNAGTHVKPLAMLTARLKAQMRERAYDSGVDLKKWKEINSRATA